MCDLVTALSVGSAVTGYVGQANAAEAENAANLQAQLDAGYAAGWKYADEGKRFTYNARELQQQGYDLAIKARENLGTGMASAGSAGVAGLTLGALVSNSEQKAAENTNRLATKREDLGNSYVSNVKSIEAGNMSVINSTPMNPGANPLNLAIGVATPIAKSDWGKENLKFV